MTAGSGKTRKRPSFVGAQMVDEGADIVDVGGESTRPGAAPVTESEELRRVVPVVKELARRLEDRRARISVDTRKPAVAEAALEAGATIINDVSASLWPVAAEAGAGWVAMHMRGEPSDMMSLASYTDVVSEVKAFPRRAGRAGHRARGAVRFGSTPASASPRRRHTTWQLLAHLDELVATGWPWRSGCRASASSARSSSASDGSAGPGRGTPGRLRWRAPSGPWSRASPWSASTT